MYSRRKRHPDASVPDASVDISELRHVLVCSLIKFSREVLRGIHPPPPAWPSLSSPSDTKREPREFRRRRWVAGGVLQECRTEIHFKREFRRVSPVR
ncbi:unnamed protein product [Ectocarpus sp. CCAP 1310/34]|nr:unnamed protein product [Ectocarpus sp. CCAP 1310/34]